MAAVCMGRSGTAPAQTSSARAESLEITGRADELLASSEHRRAAQRYRRAVEIDETNERAYVGLSSALDSLNRHEEALEILDTAQSLLGWTPDIGVQRGIHLTRLKRWDDAVASLERALKAVPKSFEAAYYLAGAQLTLEDWDGAVAAFDRYLDARPNALAERDTAVKTRRAFALLSAGEYAQARRDLDAVLADDPGSLSARMLLFSALAKEGNCDRALELYEDIQQLASTAPTMLYNAAVCQFRAGDGRAALTNLDAYEDAQEPPKLALLLRARIHLGLGEPDLAENRYREAITAGVPAELELAGWLSGRGNHAAVVELLWPLVANASRDPEVLALAASALAAETDFDRAAVATARLVEVQPEVHSWMLHGRIQLKRSVWVAAEQAYTKALDAEPDRPKARVGLRRALEHQADAAFRAKDLDAARRLLSRAHNADPSAVGAAYNLALLELERPERTIELVEPLIARMASPARGRLLLARAHMQAENAKAAIRELEAVVGGDSAPPELERIAVSHLAHALARSAPDRAIEQIARAHSLGDDNDAASALLDRAEAQARLALAERIYRRGKLKPLRAALRRVAVEQLKPEAQVRAKLIELFSTGQSKGLPAALRSLEALTDDDLASVTSPELPPSTLRHAIAIDLGARFIERSADYRRYLRSHAQALHAGGRSSSVAGKFLAAWYDRMLGWAIAKPARALARSLAKAAPAAVRSPVFEHNAIVAAAATQRGHKRLTKAQVTRLEKLASTVPEALVNLAIDAEGRGDHASVLVYLNKIPAADRTRSISEWIRWKELLHGSR